MKTDRDTTHETPPDPEMENRVSSWLTDTDLSTAEAQQGIDRLLDEFPVTPQTRRRFLGRWLDRDEGARRRAGDSDPTPVSTRRTKLMFSATAITAAIAIVALASNVVTTTPVAPGAEGGTTHVVAADGSGDFTTITDAIGAASDGDTVSILPGAYAEAPFIDKELTLAGDGPRSEIVISLGDGEMMTVAAPVATIRDLTVTGESSHGVRATGGAPVIEHVLFRSVGVPYDGRSSCSRPCVSLRFQDGAQGVVRDSDFANGGAVEVDGGADALIEDNRLSGGPYIALFDIGDATEVRNNLITGALMRAIGLLGDAAPLIEGNTLEDPGPTGIDLREGSAIVRDNHIVLANTGIAVLRDAAGTRLEGNRLTANEDGIRWSGPEGAIEDNFINQGDFGMIIAMGAPSLSGNTVCANEFNVVIGDQAEPADDGTNEICEDAPAE